MKATVAQSLLILLYIQIKKGIGMRSEKYIPQPLQGAIYTLAQVGTGKAVKSRVKPQIRVSGNGSDMSNHKRLLGKARRKMITRAMVLSLIDVVGEKDAPERKQAYWNTFHCQNRLISAGGRLYSTFCKNRFCTLCCANRKAEIMNKYLPILNTWKEPYFVTLTVQAVGAKHLKFRMKKVVRAFEIIKSRCKKRYQRGKGEKFVGVKSLECNFNSVARTYNPHLHLIVPNKEIAEILVKEWLSLWTDNDSPKHRRWANKLGQKIRKVESTERDLIEIVKYGSKIFTEPDVRKKSKNKNAAKIYAAALDNIFFAMKGIRIFERFGFNLPKSEKFEKGNSRTLDNYEEWKYVSKQMDWVDTETEKTLTDYLPTSDVIFLLENNINKTLV